MSILLLDDEEVFAKMLSFVCASAGAKFYYARTIDEAKEIVKKNHIKYAIIDQNLKNEKGVSFNRFVKDTTADIKTIFCSGILDNIDDNELSRFDFVIDKSELITFLNKLLLKS
ncbi:hypothetical protein LF845_00400 [Deferribacterales bacterium Es71-Z0220]|uniref:response regulator n=1 Tax=Deferrivibrio essentukiensis TaxID=2880922 RepID=UPI001F606E10|nr:response regulator [Deferrivibrio essentukiensis]MCB4203414.1 hypothetical protein [Deferrivibrio essentukiensis]